MVPPSSGTTPFRYSTTCQNVRFSFYQLPVFWRVDLTVISDRDSGKKWPSPFPEWATGTSALMNAVWAIKHYECGNGEDADHDLACACDKLGEERLKHSTPNRHESPEPSSGKGRS